MYKETIEYGLKLIDTSEVAFSTFESEYAANKFRSRYIEDRNAWIIVKRVVRTYEWEEIE